MGVTAWIMMGLFAGWMAGWLTGRRAAGCLPRLAGGVLGALVGGALARAAGYRGVTELSLRSLAVATAGAALLLLVLQAVEGRRR